MRKFVKLSGSTGFVVHQLRLYGCGYALNFTYLKKVAIIKWITEDGVSNREKRTLAAYPRSKHICGDVESIVKKIV